VVEHLEWTQQAELRSDPFSLSQANVKRILSRSADRLRRPDERKEQP
jgi:hypothetical protein